MILVDSNVWIFAETKGTPEHYLAIEKLQRHLRNRIGINLIIFSEVFHKLSVLFDSAVARKRVETIVQHHAVEWLELTKQQAEHAVELAEKKLLRINDAMIAEQALELDLSVLTDNVKDFRKVQKLQILPLR